MITILKNQSHSSICRYSAWVFAVMLACAIAGMPQSRQAGTGNEHRVTGKVVDQSGAALPRVTVQIRDKSGKLVADAQTNSRGELALDLSEGDYLVTATLAGFAPLRNQTLVVTPSTPPFSLVLQVPAVEQQIVVTATATEAPLSQVGSSTTVLKGDQLAREGAVTVADALRRVAGLALVQSGSVGQITSLFVRGGESKYTKILIDGIAVNEPGGSYNFANLSIADIDRIEIVRGPQSALFGSDAIAGVIQIFTHRGTSEGLSPKPRALFEGGSFASYRYAGGIEGRGKRVDYSASFTRSDTDNDVLNGSFNEETVAGNLGIATSKNTELRAVFRSEAGRAGVPGQYAFQRPDADEYYRHRDLSGGLTFTHQVTVSWAQKMSYTVNDSRQFSDDPIDSGSYVPTYQGRTTPFPLSDFTFQTLNQTRRQRIGYQSDLNLPKGHILTAGADYERESGVVGDPNANPLEAVRNNYGGYVQDQWAFRNRLFAAAGVRLEHNENFGFFATPRLSLAAHLHQPAAGSFWGLTKLKGNFGMGIKEPTLVESYSNSPYFRGNPNLRPEKSVSFDAGIEQHFASGRGDIEATYFDNRFRNQIGFVTTNYNTFEGTFFNIGKTRARGVEIVLRQELGWHWEIAGAYTFLDGKVLESTSAFDPVYAPGQQLLRRPRHSGYVDLRWKPGRWTLGATGQFAGSRVDSDFEGLGLTRNPGYSILNLLASFRISDSTSLYAVVNNARNEKYMEVLGYPALRANFRVGIRTGF
jgi:outer membrane cobalamin receptor